MSVLTEQYFLTYNGEGINATDWVSIDLGTQTTPPTITFRSNGEGGDPAQYIQRNTQEKKRNITITYIRGTRLNQLLYSGNKTNTPATLILKTKYGVGDVEDEKTFRVFFTPIVEPQYAAAGTSGESDVEQTIRETYSVPAWVEVIM